MAPNNVVNVQLNANTATFVTGMSKAALAAKNAGKEIRSAFDRIGDVASVALAPFGELGVVMGNAFRGLGDLAPEAIKSFGGLSAGAASFVAAGAGFVAAGAAVAGTLGAIAIAGADAVERLEIISQKTGISVRDLQIFAAAGATVDVSLEDMVTATRKLDQALTGTSKGAALAKVVLHELGVTSRDPKEALLQVADAFSQMKDGPIKGAEAIALFGRSGLTLIPLLNKGREGIDGARTAVERYGPVLGGVAIATEKWKVATRDLSLSWDDFKVNVTAGVLPILSGLAEKIASVVTAMGDLVGIFRDSDIFAAFITGAAPLLALLTGVGSPKQSQAPYTGPGSTATNNQAFPIDGLALYKKKWQELEEITAAGGRAAYALEKQKLEIQGAELTQNFKLAETLRASLPYLEAAAKVEKEMTSSVEARIVARLHEQQALRNQSAGRELGPQFKPDFFEHRAFEAGQGAPDVEIGQEQLDAIGQSIQHVLAGNTQEGAASGAGALAAFYEKWNQENKKATEQITADYQKNLVEFEGLLALGEISEKQFQDVRVALQQEASRKIIKARDEEIKTWDEEALKWGTVKDKFQALTNELSLEGNNLGGKVFESFHKALDDLSSQLAQFVVTGKANFKQLFQSLEESIAKAGFQKIFSSVANGIGSKFGLSTKGPSGTALDPIFVQMAGAGDLGGIIPAAGGSSGEGGLGGFFGLFKNLIPGLASGGDVTPGRAYVVGERHPEFFIPNAPGHVSPAVSMGGHQTHVTMNIHGVQDADSFRRSQSQIMGDLHRALATAHGRNY
jgi:lambda family phage tail tape measure protein